MARFPGFSLVGGCSVSCGLSSYIYSPKWIMALAGPPRSHENGAVALS